MPWCGAMPPKFAGKTDAEWAAGRARQTQQGRIQDLLRRPAKKARVDDVEEEEDEQEFGKDWGFGFLDCGECGANFMVGNCGEGERISGAFADRDKGLCYDCIDKI